MTNYSSSFCIWLWGYLRYNGITNPLVWKTKHASSIAANVSLLGVR